MKRNKGVNRSIMRVRTSRKLYIPLYAMILILGLAILYLHLTGNPPNKTSIQLSIGFTILCILATEIHRLYRYYEINSNTLIYGTGILGRKERRLDLVSISDADSVQDPWQRLWRFGDVNVRLFSKESTMEIKHINNPARFVNCLENEMANKEGGGSKL
jgi:membrane protein YdbS with pleckstrin-like domain